MLTILPGCLLAQVGAPPGAGPLRYRDPVFSSVSITPDLVYGSAPDQNNQPVTLDLNLYEPAGDTVAQRPAVVMVHAGGFYTGDKAGVGWQTYAIDPLVRRGFVVVSINYRLLGHYGCILSTNPPQCMDAILAGIHDAQAAVRWLRANAATYRIDTNRLAVEGFSAGGIIATGVGVMSDQPGDSGNPGFSSRVGAWLAMAGGLPKGEFVDASDPPGYLFTGSDDTVVPHVWSEDTAHALDTAGGEAVLATEEGVGHAPPKLGVLASQSANFYYVALDLVHALR
jgi:acetyl esterase/lipase